MLLYSYKNKSKKENDIIESKHFPKWTGPSMLDLPDQPNGELVNLLDILKEFHDSSESTIDLTGYWSRPLNIFRSSPLVLRQPIDFIQKESVVVSEQPIHVIIADLLKSMTIISVIRELATEFNTNEKILSHKSIWTIMKNYSI
jgi:hypothetical protein